MTHLQILRSLLQAGYSVTLAKLDDGYHVQVSTGGQAGEPAVREIVDPRLDQAINQLLGFSAKEVEAKSSGEG